MSLSWIKGADDGNPFFATFIEALAQALRGLYVADGLEVSPGTGLTVSIAAGTIKNAGTSQSITAASLSVPSNSNDYEVYHVVAVDVSTSTVVLIQGGETVTTSDGLISKTPRVSDTHIPLAVVRVLPGASGLTTADIYDVRVTSDLADKVHTHTIGDITDLSNASVSYATNAGHANTAGDADTVDGKHASDFAAASHTHTRSDITDFAHTHTKADITDFAHTHTIDDITDLSNASVSYASNAGHANTAGDADTVDGKHASDFAAAVHAHTLRVGDGSTTKITLSTDETLHMVAGSNISITYDDTGNKITIANTYTAPVTSVNGKTGDVSLSASDVGAAPSSHTHTKADITDFAHTHTISDITDLSSASVNYASSAGNADTVDGYHASDFIKTSGGSITGGSLYVDANPLVIGSTTKRVSGEGIELHGGTSSAFLSVQDGNGRIQLKWNATRGTGETYLVSNENAGMWEFDPASPGSDLFRVRYAEKGTAGDAITWTDVLKVGTSTFEYMGHKVWHEGNDGSGSGLDADTVDGKHASDFAAASHTHTASDITDLSSASVNYANSAGNADKVDGYHYADILTNARKDASRSLVIETRTSDPTSPATGQIWLRTDL